MRCSSSMTSVIALLWDNFALSLSTIASVILISLRQSEIAADFSENRSVLFPSALDTIAEEDSSRVIQNLVLDRNLILELMIIAQNNILRILQRSMIDQGHLRKRCEDLKLLRCLIRPSLRHEKHRSFLFSRVDLLNRTDPGETVRNVESYML